ncbi:hypothetical protein L1887_22094 [Cichorium endivia]|nr:hypothetical protein L1887_22094 [Cichorium endivia]
MVAAARAGKSKFIIGDGTNMYDFTYVENVAHAHVCAERALASEGSASKRAAGEAKNQDSCICHDAYCKNGGTYLQHFRPLWNESTTFNPFKNQTFDLQQNFLFNKSKRFLGYVPIVPLQEGLKQTIESYSDLRAELLPRKEGPSKAAVYLGDGMVADILVWRERRLTCTAIVALLIRIFDPESKFQFSEDMTRRSALSLASSWNYAVNNLKSISSGNDWMLFFKMALSLLFEERLDSYWTF